MAKVHLPYGAGGDHLKDGGHTGAVPVVVAGGEYVIHPDDVTHIGGGDMENGHKQPTNQKQWAMRDSNPHSRDYESPALTVKLIALVYFKPLSTKEYTFAIF